MNKALPKVSVIVTTYNQEDTLAATLESILAQDCVFPFEIELADDCSTDSTGDICREYARRYPHIIRYTRNKVNRGARDNYFDTLLRCRAPYIADVAGDDLWCDTSKLRRQADILDRNPDITLVHTGWQYLDAATGATRPSDADTTAPWMQPVADGRMLLEPLLAANGSMTVHSCTCLFRKQTFIDAYKADEPLFRSGEYPCEDLQLIAVLAAAGKVAYIHDITLNYRVGHSSQLTSAADAARAFRFYFGTLRLRLRLQRKFGIRSAAIDRANTKAAAYVSSRAFAAADSKAVSELLDFCHTAGIALPASTRAKLLLRHLPRPLFALLGRLRR